MTAAVWGALLVVLFGVAAIVGVSAYIDYHRPENLTHIDVEVEDV